MLTYREAKMLENESLTFVGQLKQEFVGRHDRLLKPGSNSLLDGQKAVNSLLKNFVKLMQTVLYSPPCISLHLAASPLTGVADRRTRTPIS